MDPVDKRHILEATDEVHNWLDSNGNRLDTLDDDKRLAARIKCLGDVLVAHDSLGDAEESHDTARELAALALFYLARGLA